MTGSSPASNAIADGSRQSAYTTRWRRSLRLPPLPSETVLRPRGTDVLGSEHYNALILLDPPLYMRDVADDIFFGLARLGAAKTRLKRSRFPKSRGLSGPSHVRPQVRDALYRVCTT